jgi:hypothetical protein
MSIRIDPCYSCGTARCPYCPVTKVKIRAHAHARAHPSGADLSSDDEVADSDFECHRDEW